MVKKAGVTQAGFTYLAILILIAVMSVGLARVGEVWHTQLKREKEEQLLFAGDQIRAAITMYYAHAPSPVGRFPTSLEDLLKDPRYPATKRYLRRIYADPMTNGTKWELVKNANGDILGVHSGSDEEPIKKSSFGIADQDFEGKTKYSEWVFVVSPKLFPAPMGAPPQGAAPAPAAKPAPTLRGNTR